MNTNRDNPAIYTLGAEPKETFSIEEFFDEENGKLFELVRNPTYLRYMGWNMLTLDYPKIRDGKCWEVKNGDRKTVRLYEDGVLIALADTDDNFLGWGRDHGQFIAQPKINNIAMVEYTYEFVELYRNIINTIKNKVSTITFSTSLFRIKDSASKKLLFNEYESGNIFGHSEDLIEVTEDITKNIDIQLYDNNYDSSRVAFRLLVALYTRIGIPENKMPYIKIGDDGKRSLDIEKIKNTR